MAGAGARDALWPFGPSGAAQGHLKSELKTLFDTNVISESLRQEPHARVLDWMDAQALETLYLSAITVAELRAGIALMPLGKRRDGLHQNLEKRLLPMFAHRVLSFDLACTTT